MWRLWIGEGACFVHYAKQPRQPLWDVPFKYPHFLKTQTIPSGLLLLKQGSPSTPSS